MLSITVLTARKITLAICVVSVLLLSAFSIFTADDSYIVLRYAENVIQHGELSFNLTEKVSALTSPLHALVLVVLSAFFGDYVLHVEKFFMCVLLFITAFQIAKPYKNQPLLYIFPFAVILLSPFILMWTVGGLETIILLFIITLLCVKSLQNSTQNLFYQLCLLGGLAFITRYDSVLFTAPFLFIYFLARFRTLRNSKTIAIAIFTYVILPILWLGFSLCYFHDILPTSFYSKIKLYFNFDTVIYCFQFLLYIGFLPFYALGLFLLLKQGKLNLYLKHFQQYAHIHLALLPILLYGFYNAQVHMMFGYRMLIPFAAPLLLIVMDVLSRAFPSNQTKAFFGKRAYAGLLILFVAFQFFHSNYFYYHSINGISHSGEYPRLGIIEYKDNFLQVLEDGAIDIRKHMQTQPKFRQRPATFLTHIEGLIPYRIKDLYVYGPLISIRKNDTNHFSIFFAPHSDYTYFTVPYQQNIIDSLKKQIDGFTLISDRTIIFDGADLGFQIYYNPKPKPLVLTKYVRDKPQDVFVKARGMIEKRIYKNQSPKQNE